MCSDGTISRRKVMKWVVAGIGATTTGLLGIPSVATILSPVIKKKEYQPRWRSLGEFNTFPMGLIKSVRVNTRLEKELMSFNEHKDVYVWRKSGEDVVVYSRSCTDLGCPVNYDSGSECFFCPCHGGIFSKEGERMAGPPKSPLYRYTTRVVDGHLEIDLASVPVVA